jgi:DNA-binding PadR family transcriptional regulator
LEIEMDVTNIKKACSETLVLALLGEREMHGYEIASEIDRRSNGYFTLKHGTLYPTLHRLEEQGLVSGEWVAGGQERPRKYYRLTKKGHDYRNANTSEWRDFVVAIAALVPGVAT